MSNNLLELINENFTGDVVSKLADFLGESRKSTSLALDNAIPTILAGLVNKGSELPGATIILSQLSQGSHDGGILNNLVNVFSGGAGTSKLLATGAKLLKSVFHNKTDGVAKLIANASGISQTSSNSLLRVLMPVIFGVLGKTIKAEGITSPAGLVSFLGKQRGFLKNLLPAGLSSALRLDNIDEKRSGGFLRFLPWLLLPLLLALGWWFLKNHEQPTAPVPEVSVPKVSAPDASKPAIIPPAVEKASDFFETTLSSGYAIKGPKEGIESKLIAFIQDTGKAVDEKLWFSMDGTAFDTDRATLTEKSAIQVRNIAEILKAFPKVKIKIGGYSDNTGDEKANLALSADRANTIKKTLAAMGIDATRLDAKGYGGEHPVATNETEAGRQQNRRIDIQVTAK